MVYIIITEREVHKMIKTLVKRLFCKHEYKWCATTTLSNSAGLLDHELIIIYVECEKCGKRKSIEFKKTIDK
jgi:transcription elongation factor Elf1